MSALLKPATAYEPADDWRPCWQPLHTKAGEYLDTGGHGRLTIRPRSGGGYALRINGHVVATFPSVGTAKQGALSRALVMRASAADAVIAAARESVHAAGDTGVDHVICQRCAHVDRPNWFCPACGMTRGDGYSEGGGR